MDGWGFPSRACPQWASPSHPLLGPCATLLTLLSLSRPRRLVLVPLAPHGIPSPSLLLERARGLISTRFFALIRPSQAPQPRRSVCRLEGSHARPSRPSLAFLPPCLSSCLLACLRACLPLCLLARPAASSSVPVPPRPCLCLLVLACASLLVLLRPCPRCLLAVLPPRPCASSSSCVLACASSSVLASPCLSLCPLVRPCASCRPAASSSLPLPPRPMRPRPSSYLVCPCASSSALFPRLSLCLLACPRASSVLARPCAPSLGLVLSRLSVCSLACPLPPCLCLSYRLSSCLARPRAPPRRPTLLPRPAGAPRRPHGRLVRPRSLPLSRRHRPDLDASIFTRARSPASRSPDLPRLAICFETSFITSIYMHVPRAYLNA